MTAIQNFGLAVFPQVIASIRGIRSIQGTPMEFVASILVFIACAGIACLLTVVLIGRDRQTGTRMNATAAERAQRKAEEQREGEKRKVLDDGEEEGVGRDDDEDGVEDQERDDGVNSALEGNGVV